MKALQLPSHRMVVAGLFAWLLTCSCCEVEARQINWRSPSAQENVSSQGLPFSSQYLFELGVFAGDFVPSRENLEDWRDHWLMIDRAVYNEAGGAFASSVFISSNANGLTAGKEVYVLAYSVGAKEREAMLFRGENWFLPSPAPMAFPLTWVVTEDAQLTLGSIYPAGGIKFMESEALPDEAVLYGPEEWRWAFFGDEADFLPEAGWRADADGDGSTNCVEYRLGTDPLSAASDPLLAVRLSSSSPNIILSGLYLREGAGVLQWSLDMYKWEEVTLNESALANGGEWALELDVDPMKCLRLFFSFKVIKIE